MTASSKAAIRAHWEQEPCGVRYGDGTDAAGRRRSAARARYALEPYIPAFADFPAWRGRRVLEVGVGAGVDFSQFVRHGANAAGIDLTAAGVPLARDRLRDVGRSGYCGRVARSDAEELPFRDGSFDLVYAWGVLHHTPDTARALREAWRVLRPGGRFKAMLYHLHSWTVLLLWVRHALLAGRPWTSPREVIFRNLESPGTKAYTRRDAAGLVAGAGFELEAMRTVLGPGDLLQIRLSRRYRGVPRWLVSAWPRWLLRLIGPRFGLYLLMDARKPPRAEWPPGSDRSSGHAPCRPRNRPPDRVRADTGGARGADAREAVGGPRDGNGPRLEPPGVPRRRRQSRVSPAPRDGAGAAAPVATGPAAADRWRDCLYLFPQLFGAPGGIQTVNGDTLRAMTRVCPSARHRVLLYHDREFPGRRRPPGGGGRVRFVPCGRAGGPSRFRFARAFAAALAERRPDLIVVGHAGLAPMAWLAKRVLGIPYVVWIHDVEVGRLRGRGCLAGLRDADRLVAVSRHTSRALSVFEPLAAGRTTVLPNAVRDRFRPGSGAGVRRRLGLDREPVLLTVARYDSGARYKGYDLVVRALPAVLRRRPDVRYVLVGQGGDLARVRALSRELGVDHAVVCAGAVADDALPTWYNACDLFVMPSRLEGFGIVFIEALACGKPVIAGDRGGARDALLDGRLGRLVDPDDPGRLAEVILEFVTGRAPAALTDPETLSRECVRRFGFAAFERRVRSLIARLDGRNCP